MGLINSASIEEVRARAILTELFREVTDVNERGRRSVCCCPFHQERTPSCYIDNDRGRYHCFGCGAAGDAFSFVMTQRGLSFVEAIEYLAEKYRVPLVRTEAQPGDRDRGVLARVNQMAQDFFVAALGAAPKGVHEYLAARGITDELKDKFTIGYAPVAGSALTRELTKAGIADSLLQASGLVRVSRDGRRYDLFRGRVIFPILHPSGRVLGFGGRVVPSLFSNQELERFPKYINSPETLIYKKHRVLYGLPQATEAIRAAGEVYLVEGYMDVVSLYGAGLKNAVACCGTAVGMGHVEALRGSCQRLVLLMDGDAAGQKAAQRSYPALAGAAVEVLVAVLPEGEDPDSLVRRAGKEAVAACPRELLVDMFLHGLVHAAQGGKGGAGKDGMSKSVLGPGAKEKILGEILGVVRRFTSPVAQDDVLRRAAGLLGVGIELVYRLLQNEQTKHGSGTAELGSSSNLDNKTSNIELLAAAGTVSQLERELVRAIFGAPRAAIDVFPLTEVGGMLQPAARMFVSEYLTRLARLEAATASVGADMIAFIEGVGEPWWSLWREVKEMRGRGGVDFGRLLRDCTTALRRRLISERLRLLEDELVATQEEGERLRLLSQKVAMVREAKQV